MQFNPHSLHQILVRIREQMRCPQCGTRVHVDFPSVKLVGNDFVLLQLKCETCSAFIVLHVNVAERNKGEVPAEVNEAIGAKNASSMLMLDESEMKTLRGALEKSGGSFEKLFKEVPAEKPAEQPKLPAPKPAARRAIRFCCGRPLR